MADPAGSQRCGTTVRVRFRPRSAKEADVRSVEYGPGEGCFSFAAPDGTRHSFTFDKVYGEASSQEQVFSDLAPVAEAALAGFNGTIMAYGQTGSGKTHTLLGNMSAPAHRGMVPRAVAALAAGIEAAGRVEAAEFSVGLSVVEIYCERIRDLLGPGGAGGEGLAVKEDPARGVYIEGATEVGVTDEAQLEAVMAGGLAQRAVSATAMNEASSRSHCIVMLRVDKSLPDGTIRAGKLVLVDLAGSERADRTGAAGATLVEGSQINKSLSCLSNVIFALTEDAKGGRPRHVPYRDSKLTRVLQDSLGGTARTVLIVCCSPAAENAAETLSSLRFGSRAKGVQNTVTANTRTAPEKLQQMVNQLKAKNAELLAELAAAKAGLTAPQPPPTAPLPPAPPSAPSPAAATATTAGGAGASSGNVSGAAGAVGGSGAGGDVRELAEAVAGRCRDAAAGLRLLWESRRGSSANTQAATTNNNTSSQPAKGKKGGKAAAAAAEGAGTPAEGREARPGPSLRQAEAMVDVGAAAALALGLAACAVWEATAAARG
ncbi:hypothetical protein HYH03_014372 [Edaphochlamys debaryana]|uniref:Kinesin-like protein n=1 Tax=Edaphochlamys debaryana TaxID=47281 RepID=A0A836BS92_9CHLO|nr:hypothetical protein HYH03_014372 [Edaphochlamys debaryana]|eukprot:KAG2487000.1 hypothetical protein HYH03_014372 [Edaphochlamys debaryana]